MQETKTQLSKGFRTIIAQKKDRLIHSQNGQFQIEGIKMLKKRSRLEQQKESENKRLSRNQLLNLLKQPRLSLRLDYEKKITNIDSTRKNYTQQKPSVLNFEFSLDQNASKNKSIDINNKKLQWNKQQRKDIDLTERERFYTVQFITKSERQQDTRNLLKQNILKNQKLENSPKMSSHFKQKYRI